MVLGFGLMYGRYRIIAYKEATAQIPGLVAMTLDRLATQAALKEDERLSEEFISVRQLRDDLLRNVFNVRERERVWDHVKKIVEGNSNVRAGDRESSKTGEISRVWQWTGPLDLAPELEGRKSGLLRNSPVETRQQEDAAVRKWDEGRPIY
jgi:Man1-Src1p-C-terminal domain